MPNDFFPPESKLLASFILILYFIFVIKECRWSPFKRGEKRLIISQQVTFGLFCSKRDVCAQWLFLCVTGLSGRPGMPYSRTDEERPQPNWITSITADCRLHHGQFFFRLYFTSPQYVSFGKFKKTIILSLLWTLCISSSIFCSGSVLKLKHLILRVT